MTETILFPDAEIAVCDELEDRLPGLGEVGVSATTMIPAGPPAKFIRVVQTGGVARDLVTDVPSITVECFAKTESAASVLARRARAALDAAGRAGSMGGHTCYGVTLFGLPQNFPQATVTGRFRYTFTISVALRGAAV